MLKSLQIGSLFLLHNLLLAPMAGITNLPFRILCRRFGAALAYTEMVSVNGMIREGAKTFALLRSLPEDRPLGIQLFGESAESLAEAARCCDEYGDLLDINMGCPVKKVVGTGAGSALLKDLPRIAGIIRAVRKATKLPLTIKIRSGWSNGDNVFLDVGHIAQEEGCDAITLHPRSRCQMFEGKADWEQISVLKTSLRIPVIGCGDLFSAANCLRMLSETGCDGIMIARGALGAPWIFSQVTEISQGKPLSTITGTCRALCLSEHLELFVKDSGHDIALKEMKKHLAWYSRGFPGAADIRRAANTARTIEDLHHLTQVLREAADGKNCT